MHDFNAVCLLPGFSLGHCIGADAFPGAAHTVATQPRAGETLLFQFELITGF